MSPSTVIARVENVSKRFIMHREKTLKERVLNFKNSRASREDFWALRNIDLEIHAGTTVGLVGHNGSGKSTLLKILGGIIEPTSGQVFRKGRIAPLLELGAGFHPDLSGRENIYLNAAILGLTKTETDRHFDAIVDFSGIEPFIDTQVKFYSSGMYVRLAFSIAVHVDPDFLLVDEVLAVGDQPFQQKCMAKISEFQRDGRTIALVSHSAAQINEVCDTVAVLESGNLIFQGGTAEGLKILQRSYSSRQQSLAQLIQEGSLPAIDVGDLEIIVASGDSKSTNLLVTFPITINFQVEPWILGLTLSGVGEERIFNINTRDLGIVLPRLPGQYNIEFSLNDLHLNSGNYNASYGAILENETLIASQNPAGSFQIQKPSQNRGFITADTSVKILD